jgi:hypothetical protein
MKLLSSPFQQWTSIRSSTLPSVMKLIPITVVQNDNIDRSKIDAQTTSTGHQQDEFLTTRFIVLVNGSNMILVSGTAVNSTIFYGEKEF